MFTLPYFSPTLFSSFIFVVSYLIHSTEETKYEEMWVWLGNTSMLVKPIDVAFHKVLIPYHHTSPLKGYVSTLEILNIIKGATLSFCTLT